MKRFGRAEEFFMRDNGRDARYWVEKLGLVPHPEGGYYRQTYRADFALSREALSGKFSGDRPVATAIYFLLDGGNFSAFHRLRSDEMWHFYAGCSLAVHVIDPSGNYSRVLVGDNVDSGESFQSVVRAGSWFASEVRDGKSWALVGCTVAPGFNFDDFELGEREMLVRQFPQHREVIERLTR